MSEQVKNLEQYSDTKIREIITDHPKVFPSGGRPEDSEIEQSKIDLGKIVRKFTEIKFNFDDSGEEKAKITKFKKEFEELYKNLEKEGFKNKETINPIKIEELREKFEKLVSQMIMESTVFQLKIWNCDLTENEIRQGLKKEMSFGELNFRINNQGKLERTCYFDWIGKKLPKVGKFQNDENEVKNLENKNRYLRKALKLAIQLTNAHFFGIVKTRQEIDELAKNKEEAVKEEQENQRQNTNQNLNSQNLENIYFAAK